MGTLERAFSRRCLAARFTIITLTAAATLLPAGHLFASRNADGTGASRSRRLVDGTRTVGSAPGFEIRSDARAVYSMEFSPGAGATQAVSQFAPNATVGGDAVVTPPGWQALPLYAGTISGIAASPIDPNLICCSTDIGFGGSIFESDDGGVTWSLALAELGQVGDIEFASDGTFHVASVGHGYRHEAGSSTWDQFDLPAAVFTEVGVNPTNLDEIWLSGRIYNFPQPLIVWRSHDRGAHWDNVTPPVTEMICTGIAFNRDDTRKVVTCYSDQNRRGEVWRSLDGGETWARGFGFPAGPLNDLVFDGTRFFLGGGNEGFATFGAWASADDGATWARVSNAAWPSRIVYDLDSDPTQPGVVLAATGRGLTRGVNGAWSHRVGGTFRSLSAASLSPGNSSRILVGQTPDGILLSTDGGGHFTISTTGIRAVNVVSVAVNPLDPLEITAAFQGFNGGGVFTSADGGQTWKLESLPATRFDAVEYAPDGTLYVYSQGPSTVVAPEGVYRRDGGGGTWTALGPFVGPFYETDGSTIRVAPHHLQTIIITGADWSTDTPGIWRTINGGTNWDRVYIGTNRPGELNLVTDVQFVNDGTDQIVIASNSGVGAVLMSIDGGATWSPVQGFPDQVRSYSLRGTPADPLTFYLGSTVFGGCYRTRDAGATWSLLGSSRSFAVLDVDHSNADVTYGLGGFPVGVWRSTGGSAAFAPFNQGCEDAGYSDFGWREGDCPTLLLATARGVYVRDIDSTPPNISLTLEPNVLWPPDHKLRTIRAHVTTSDTCDPNPTFALKSIAIQDGDATGVIAPQDMVAGLEEETSTFQLRAERPGKGDRRYLVTYTATDANGNTTDATATVLVPHDQSGVQLVNEPGAGRAIAMKTELISIEPNPFNPETAATFTLAGSERVALDVYDVHGARVRNLAAGVLPAGAHRIAWDGVDDNGRSAASGVYFFRFVAGAHVQTLKALLIK